MIKHILSILMIFMTASSAIGSESVRLADENYSKGNFKEAINLYNKAIADEGTSSELYYNLGNAYYRTDSLARAIISYERALKLDPTNQDALTNLQFVNTKIADMPADNSSYTTFFLDKAVRALTANGWAIVSISLFALILLLAGGYVFLDSIPLRKFCFFTDIILLVVLVGSLFITLTATRWQSSELDAIIIVPSTQLSTSPSTPLNSSQQAFLLHEGTKVEILDSVATPLDPATPMWYEVMVGGEHRAWVDSRDIEKI